MQPKEGIRSLLIHGTPEPRVIVPQHKELPIVAAKSLNSLPPVLDALPARSDGRTVPIITSQVSIPRQELLPNVPHVDPVKKPTIEFVLVGFDNPNDLKENARIFNRSIQRIEQYEKLMKFIAGLDAKMQQGDLAQYHFDYEKDGNTKKAVFTASPESIAKFKRVAASFYADELRNDNFTRELAKNVRGRVMLKEDTVVREAEQIIFETQRHRFTEIEVKKTEITSQKEKEDVQPTGTIEKKEEKKSEAKDEKKPPETPSELPFDEETMVGLAEELLRLDRPSKNSAAFLQELWNKPF